MSIVLNKSFVPTNNSDEKFQIAWHDGKDHSAESELSLQHSVVHEEDLIGDQDDDIWVPDHLKHALKVPGQLVEQKIAP